MLQSEGLQSWARDWIHPTVYRTLLHCTTQSSQEPALVAWNFTVWRYTLNMLLSSNPDGSLKVLT